MLAVLGLSDLILLRVKKKTPRNMDILDKIDIFRKEITRLRKYLGLKIVLKMQF